MAWTLEIHSDRHPSNTSLRRGGVASSILRGAPARPVDDADHVVETLQWQRTAEDLQAQLRAAESLPEKERLGRELDTALRSVNEAFRQLHDKYAPRVARMAWGLVQETGNAPVLVQETMIRMVRHLPQLSAPEKFQHLLFAIAANFQKELYWKLKADQEHCMPLQGTDSDSGEADRVLGSALETRIEPLPDSVRGDPEALLVQAAEREEISERERGAREEFRARLGRLSRFEYAEVLRLHFVEKLCWICIAGEMKHPLGTVKAWFVRAKEEIGLTIDRRMPKPKIRSAVRKAARPKGPRQARREAPAAPVAAPSASHAG